MLRRNFLLLTFFLFFSSACHSQPWVNPQGWKEVGTFEGFRTHIAVAGDSIKLGKGVMVGIIKENDNFIQFTRIFASCDGRYISDSFDMAISVEDDVNLRRQEISRAIRSPSKPATSAAFISSYSESFFPFTQKIRSHLSEICAKSSPEKRGFLFPYAVSSRDKDDVATIQSIVSGASRRVGETLEIWHRSHSIKKTSLQARDGSLYRDPAGEVIKFDKVLDEGSRIIKAEIICRTNKIKYSHITEYDQYGRVIKSHSFTEEYSEAVPDSLGEALVISACSIF